MTKRNFAPWNATDLSVSAFHNSVPSIAASVYQLTCRTNLQAPGFCIVNPPDDADSLSTRRLMVDLKEALSHIHQQLSGIALDYLSCGRFDQQNSTRPHLDGGPDECMLMLGYEPTDVSSQLEMLDYSRCASDHGMTPTELLEKHNPMFRSGSELLHEYTTRLDDFEPTRFQIVCINNSRTPLARQTPRWQGVLHTATIPVPDASKRRVINSTVIAPASSETIEAVDAAALRLFLTTDRVLRRGYDQPHVENDG